MAASVTEPIAVDVDQLKFLADRLRLVAPEALKAWRKVSLALGNVVEQDAASRASFSSHISTSGRVLVRATGVIVRFGGAGAWWAVPIENRGLGFVEHPTFGHAPVTSVGSHAAFLHPAFEAHRDEIWAESQIAVTEAASHAVLEGGI